MSNNFKIIIPFYNVEKWIKNCIKSIQLQNHENFQCVLIDDISDDNSYRMLFFNKIPNQIQKNELQDLGLDFLYYLPKNIFVVNLKKSISENQLRQYNVMSVNKIKEASIKLN